MKAFFRNATSHSDLPTAHPISMPSLKLTHLLPFTSLLRALKRLPYIPKNATLTLLLFVKSIRNSAEASPPTACTRLIEPGAASLWALWLGLFQAREWSVCDSSVLFLLPYRELCWQRGCCYTLHASVKLCILTGGYFRQISLLFVQSPVFEGFFLDVSRFQTSSQYTADMSPASLPCYVVWNQSWKSSGISLSSSDPYIHPQTWQPWLLILEYFISFSNSVYFKSNWKQIAPGK